MIRSRVAARMPAGSGAERARPSPGPRVLLSLILFVASVGLSRRLLAATSDAPFAGAGSFASAPEWDVLRTLWFAVAAAFLLSADAALAALEAPGWRAWLRRGGEVALAAGLYLLVGGTHHVLVPDVAVAAQLILAFAFAHATSRVVLGAGLAREGWARVGVRVVVTAFVFPLAARWTWSAQGWLSLLPWGGFHDFAGAAVVHLSGATMALAGLLVLGSTEEGSPAPSRSGTMATPSLAWLASTLAWYGWQAFSPGGNPAGADAHRLAHAALASTLAGGAAALASLLYTAWQTHRWELGRALQGMIAGLVAAAAGSDVLTPFGGLFVGVVAAACALSVRQILPRIGLTDPGQILATHGGPAVWGILAVGLFRADGRRGLLYGGSVDGLVVQLVGTVALSALALAAGLALMALLRGGGVPSRETAAARAGVAVSPHRAKARG